MSTFHLRRENFHDLQVNGKRVLLVVPDTSIFELDEISAAILDYLKLKGAASEAEILNFMKGRCDGEAVREVLDGFSSFGLIANDHEPHGAGSCQRTQINNGDALTTLVLNVSNACNMGCHYCYGGGFDDPRVGRQMEWATAKQSVDFLFQRSGQNRHLTIVFFGGEPLLNFALIRQVVSYARELASEKGKQVDFTLTTNGTALTPEVIEFLRTYRFGVTVSIDGPPEIHDQRRVFKTGRGTYDVIEPRIKELLRSYQSRPIGARVTLSRGVTAVERIFDHLSDLGFAEVGFSPVTSGDHERYTLTATDLSTILAGFQALADRFLEKALQNEYLGFSNLSQMIMDLAAGTNKQLPCGAGLGLLDVDHQGDVYLCHRFAGTPGAGSYGNVGHGGVDLVRLRRFLDAASVDHKLECRTCWIRRLCAGGCYHEAYTRYGDPLHPNLHYCQWLRSWMETGLRVYVEIARQNPGFIKTYLQPRSRLWSTSNL